MAIPFRPIPFLGNPHLQTLVKNVLPAQRFRHPTTKHIIPVEDGDRIALHDTIPPRWRPGDPIMLLVHGLSGSHYSTNVVALASLLVPHGFRVARIDLRGAGAGAGLARRIYNAGSSADVRAAAAFLHAASPESPITLIGFSLGGNIVLKLAGEAVQDPVPGLARVAAVSAPIDMVQCAAMLERPGNRFYDAYFTASLVRHVMGIERTFPDVTPVVFPRRLKLRAFDEIYTCPRHGYSSSNDYYSRTAAMHLIPHIRVPAFMLTARDDPFIAVEPFLALQRRPGLHVEITDQGGHLGFLGRDGNSGFRWIEHRLTKWLQHGSR